MPNFGTRVGDALLAAGMKATAPQLAKACKVSRSTAQRWLAMKEAKLWGIHLETVSGALNVRMHWLVTGRGLVQRVEPPGRDAEIERMFRILDALSKAQCEKWIALGEKMAAGK